MSDSPHLDALTVALAAHAETAGRIRQDHTDRAADVIESVHAAATAQDPTGDGARHDDGS